MTNVTLKLNLSEIIPFGHVCYAPSQTDPNKGYEIRMGKDGNLWCSCPAWKYQKKHPKKRSCKHLRAMLPSIIASHFPKKAA